MLKVAYTGVKQIFVATEEVRHLDAVALVSGAVGLNYAELGRDYLSGHIAAGIAYGARSGTVSGQIIRVVTHGIVSGVRLGLDVFAGDRLALASAGHVMPLNVILPLATSGDIRAMSGGIASGLWSGVASGIQGPLSGGFAVVASGAAMGAFNTGNVFARALASGSAGDGIPILVGG